MRQSIATAFVVALSAATTVMAGDPLCVTQGPGSCNGVYQCSSEIAADAVDCFFTIYDYQCNVIGEDGTSLSGAPNEGDAIDSQLPYTVDLTSLWGSYIQDQISATWDYAGGSYGKGISNSHYDDCSDGLTACAYLRAAFPC